MESSLRRLARAGYEAYAIKADNKAYDGKPMPGWDDLPEHIREKWEAAATGIVQAAAEYLRVSFPQS